MFDVSEGVLKDIEEITINWLSTDESSDTLYFSTFDLVD